MPAARPRASFEPIPPDFDVRTFVETASNFQYVDRISLEMIADQGIEQFEKLVLLHVIIGGKPLVIDGFEEVLDPWTFRPSWLRDNHGDKIENARNLTSKENIPLTIRHYLKHLIKLTEQFFDSPERYRDKARQRIYLKDIDCPTVWQDKVKEHIPAGLFYLNDSTGDFGGAGSVDEPNPNAAGFRKSRGIARAGDLMSSLPPEMRAENLMCYIGHEGTYTPAHREMCASLGQNIMVEASSHISEDGQPERPGSSIWFMTETKDRQVVSEYWLSILGHDIEVENHFAQLIAWKKAPFNVYVVEQRPGDFILIPPLAPHQVWNRGTRTMKVAWNRTTVETLELAMKEALPSARMVCRDEQYKNKAIIYYTLLKYSNLLRSARSQAEMGGEQADAVQRSIKVRQVQRDFKRLFDLYKSILLSEMFTPDSREHPEFIAYDSNVTCAYCRCNIFNRFLTCKACVFALGTDTEEPYDLCMDCYSMGRSCACQSGYQWVEQWKWKDLLHRYEEWRTQIIDIDGQVTEKTPLPLMEERRYYGKKTLAQVSQEQLRTRPFVDIAKDKPLGDESEDEIQVNDDGTVKKMVKKRSKQWLNNHKSCHVCLQRHPKWKMAFCTNCDYAYCYGSLFRAHDLMPMTIMENPSWKCPHCNRVCNTGACRRDPRQRPFEPKGTLLGHDTKKVADVRSIECLVDFGVSNLNWLRDDADDSHESVRLQQRRQEAERAKRTDPSLDARYMEEEDAPPNHRTIRNGIEYSPVEDEMSVPGIHDGLIDPSLRGEDSGFDTHHNSSRDQDSSLHRGFIEPSAVMHEYQPYDGMYEEDDSLYPDLDSEIPRFGSSRKRNRDEEDEDEEIRRDGDGKAKKKRKRDKNADSIQPPQPKNASSKQYQKEMEKRLLEEARKNGQYIMVAARMRKKSKVIKLSLSSQRLATFRTQDVNLPRYNSRHGAVEPMDEDKSILQSDILPNTNGAAETSSKSSKPTSFRYRVEDDHTFGTRDRNRKAVDHHGPSKPKKKPQYEEITVDSDEGNEEDSDEEEYTARTGSNRRASQWLARKNQGYEDLPTELPPDFKDRSARPRTERDRERDRAYRERRKTMPNNKSRAQIRPSGAPTRKSTGNMSDEDGVHEDDDMGATTLMLAGSAAAALEASRKAVEEAKAQEAQDNMRAKMMLSDDWAGASDDESIDGFIVSLANETTAAAEGVIAKPAPVRSGPPQTQKSIFSRPGMNGKKVIIVSAATRPTSSAAPAVKTTGFKAVNAPSNDRPKFSTSKDVVALSDSSDGEDEIPARLPEPSVKAASRASLGNRPSPATAKRGRGRPPKIR